MLKCLQNIRPYPDNEQHLQALPVKLLVFGALESKITHTHTQKKFQERVCWWKLCRRSSRPSRNYKSKNFPISKSLFSAHFNSLHYFTSFPSCRTAYFRVWLYFSLWDVLWCCQQLRVPAHIHTFSASWHFSASQTGACPLLLRNRCRLFLWARTGPPASIFLAELRFTIPSLHLQTWLPLFIFILCFLCWLKLL